MNFEFVKGVSPAAASMMHIAAFLESESIPIDVINPGFPELDQKELRESARFQLDNAHILKVLSSYSLFSVDQQSRVFSVHKLVQEVVRDSLTTSARIEALEAAARVLHSALRENSGAIIAKYGQLQHKEILSQMNEEERSILVALVLNFRTLKNNIEGEIDSCSSEENSAYILYNATTFKLCTSVRTIISNNVFFYTLNAELCDFELNLARMSGTADPDLLLEVMLNTSISKRNCPDSGKYEEARKLSQETVEKLAELEKSGAIIKGDIKYQVLEHRASYYALEGQWKKNYDALLELEGLQMSEEWFVDLQICIARAENYVSAGNFDCVFRRYKKALDLARSIYSPDHGELLRVLQFITVHFQNANKLQDAWEYAKELLTIAKKQPPASDCYIKGITTALSVMREFDPHSAEDTLLGVLQDRWPPLYKRCTSGVVEQHMDTCLPAIDDGSCQHAAMVLEGLMRCFFVMVNSKAQTKNKLHKQKKNFYRSVAETLLSIFKKVYGENHPEVERSYGYLVEVHKLLGNKEEVHMLSKLMKLSKDSVSNEYFARTQADGNVLLARSYRDVANGKFKSGDYSSALKIYNEALNLCSNDAKLLTNRAAVYVKLSEQQGQIQTNEQQKLLKDAVQDSEKAITSDPTWVKGYYWKAMCLAKLGERGRSLAAASVAEHLFPSKCTQIPAVVDHFGSYHVSIVNTVEDLLSATERTGDNLVILVKEGRYNLTKLLKPPKNAVMVGLENVEITCTKGVPFQRDETVYTENITISPTLESMSKLKEKAKECLHRGQLDKALSFYSEALTVCPSDAQLLTTRATTYLKLAEQKKGTPLERKSMLELALKDSEAAITADSTWLLGYYNKAVSLAELDRKHQALAAAAVFNHLSSGRDVPGVTHRYGGLQIHIVENSGKLHCVLQCVKECEGVNQVVLIKEGQYLLEKSVEITQPIVVVGQGKVTVSCKTGRPFHFTQEYYVENVEICTGCCDSQPELQGCTSSDDTHPETLSLTTPSGYEHTDVDPQCKVN